MTEKSAEDVHKWNISDIKMWAKLMHLSDNVIHCLEREGVDGQVLLTLTENDIRDFRFRMNYKLSFGELKKLWLLVHTLQRQHLTLPQIQKTQAFTSALATVPNNLTEASLLTQETDEESPLHNQLQSSASYAGAASVCTCSFIHNLTECDITPPLSVDGRATNIPPELFKTAISLAYSFAVTWITSFVMVIVHERVPDMKRYPPLPDIFLDNVPHIPWAFHMCEITGTLLFTVWLFVIIFHKYRSVLLRRFFALAGTVFLLRCVTMLITSLSVPGTHLQCNQNDYAIDDTSLSFSEALELRISRAYTIWAGLGMSIQGVRTCGDYMFSGHTVALTLMNFFITEYTPRNLYFLHTLSWLLNMFGIFFILAAHEHYSIDVFVAFYITSRLFLYYHTLANNQALMSHDSTRTRVWFPMFSYFESSVDGIIPNEYDSFEDIKYNLCYYLAYIKSTISFITHHFWKELCNFYELRNSKSVPKTSNSKMSMKSKLGDTHSTQTSTHSLLSQAISQDSQRRIYEHGLTNKSNAKYSELIGENMNSTIKSNISDELSNFDSSSTVFEEQLATTESTTKHINYVEKKIKAPTVKENNFLQQTSAKTHHKKVEKSPSVESHESPKDIVMQKNAANFEKLSSENNKVPPKNNVLQNISANQMDSGNKESTTSNLEQKKSTASLHSTATVTNIAHEILPTSSLQTINNESKKAALDFKCQRSPATSDS